MKNLKYFCMLLMLALSASMAQAQDSKGELVKNGDFDYTPRVQRGANATTGWSSARPVVVIHVDPIAEDKPNYAVICCDTLYNAGFDGISVNEGEKYDFSVCLRHIPEPKAAKCAAGNKLLVIQLVDEQLRPIAEATLKAKGCQWQKYATSFMTTTTCAKAKLAIVGVGCQKIAIDKVSLKKH